METADIAKAYLLYFILPLWILAGIADWACHRAARIELTAGPRESLIHLLMLGEAGTAIAAGLFFNITSLVLLIMLIAWAVHEVTAFGDLTYASAHRVIKPVEQWVHDYLGVIPLLALSFVVVIHWPSFLAIFGLGDQPPDWSLTFRQGFFSPLYLGPLLVAMAFNLILYLLELYRCIRAMPHLVRI